MKIQRIAGLYEKWFCESRPLKLRGFNMLGFTIEKATAADAKALADVYQDRPPTAFNRLTHGSVDLAVFNGGLGEMFAKSLHDPNEVQLVARDEGHPDRMIVSYINLSRESEVVPMTAEQVTAQRRKYEARIMPGMNGPLLIEMWEKLDRLAEQAMSGRGNYWMVDNVGTLQTHQRRGIASALIRASFELCTDLPIYLDTSGDEESTAWRLYERLGFKKVGEYEIDLALHGGKGVHRGLTMLREPEAK